jgi:hypothetical protein
VVAPVATSITDCAACRMCFWLANAHKKMFTRSVCSLYSLTSKGSLLNTFISRKGSAESANKWPTTCAEKTSTKFWAPASRSRPTAGCVPCTDQERLLISSQPDMAQEETTQMFCVIEGSPHVPPVEEEVGDCENPGCLNAGAEKCKVCGHDICAYCIDTLSYGGHYCASCCASLSPVKEARLVYTAQSPKPTAGSRAGRQLLSRK